MACCGTFQLCAPQGYFHHGACPCFFAGVVSTAVSPRLLLGLGLMATAAVNLAFGASSSMAAFCTLWGINGMLQVRLCLWQNSESEGFTSGRFLLSGSSR